MVAGDRSIFERTRPLFEAIARNVFYIGAEPGLAQITKLANNMISAAGMASAFEAVAMAVKAGVDARTLIDTINASTGRNTATTDKIPTSVLPRTFDYGGKLATMHKDSSFVWQRRNDLRFRCGSIRGRARYINTEKYMNHASLTAEAAEWLVKRGAKIVGVDFATPDLAAKLQLPDFAFPVHYTLLSQGVLIAEHVTNLGSLAGQRAEIMFMGLNVAGSDRAQARVIARPLG
jgi:hypothetical protein